jgi:hypothetical protein
MSEIEQSENSEIVVKTRTFVQVELVFETGLERLEFDIVPDGMADFPRGYLGESTPLAQAILGQPVGKTLPYHQGDALSVKVLNVRNSSNLPDENPSARRQETIRKAVEQSDRTSAMIFASSFSGKWGDYDPKGIEGWEKDSEE